MIHSNFYSMTKCVRKLEFFIFSFCVNQYPSHTYKHKRYIKEQKLLKIVFEKI